jgi:hypothetical protein
MNIKEEFLRVLTVSYWLRIGSGSRLLWTGYWKSRFCKK